MHGITSQTFAPEDLESLDHAFKTAWAMLVAGAPSRDASKDEETKTILRKKLLAIDVSALDDADMRQIASECLNSQT